MQYSDFISLLENKTGKSSRKSGSGHLSCCPAHDDSNPSLSINEGADGKILINCFAGCTPEEICKSLDLNVSDLFLSGPVNRHESVKTVYPYRDESGRELYRKVRLEPGFEGKSKSFYSVRVDENGLVVKNIKECRKVLYRLPEVLKGIKENHPIYLVEGEKDADKLASYKLIASTAPESTKWTEDFTNTLKEADIVLLFDMDETGFKRRDMLCQSLYKKVKRLRVIELPGLEYQDSHGYDVSDWLAQGHTISELLEIVSSAPDYTPPKEKSKIRIVTLGEFLQMKLPEREMLLNPVLPSQGLAMIYAQRGVGKTHAALGMACAIVRGDRFWKWNAPKQRKVLYIDGEMPAITIQERLRRLVAADEFNYLAKENLRLITPDLQEGPMPDLSTKEGRLAIEEHLSDCDLIIVDNISCTFRSGIENEAESWQPAQDWALDLRKRGKSILFIHHAGKTGTQRGSSKKEDILDTVICLKRPSNYKPSQGARFEVSFEKNRHFTGEEAAPFQVELHETDDKLWTWEVSDVLIDPDVTLVAELTKKEYTIQQIVEETGLTKNQVTGRQKKAKALGLIE